jgi:fucose permease
LTIHSEKESSALLVTIAFLSFIALGLNAGMMGVAWPSVRDTFGISQDAIGALFFASTVGALGINLSSGPIISKIGPGSLLTLGCGVGGLGYLGVALAPT